MSYLNDNTDDRLEGHDQDRHRTFLSRYSHPVALNMEDSILVLLPDWWGGIMEIQGTIKPERFSRPI